MTDLAGLADTIVLYTSVSQRRAREVVELLAAEGVAPAWFASVEILTSGATKDLTRVSQSRSATVLLIDDRADVLPLDQQACHVPVAEFAAPYDQQDTELDRVLQRVRDRLA